MRLSDWFNRKRVIFLGALLVVILVVLVFVKGQSNEIVLQAERGSIIEAVYSLGTVKSENTYTLKLAVASTVRQLYIKEGDIVRKDQALITTDSNITFRAPFSGTVSRLYYQPGEIVMPGNPVLVLLDEKNLYLQLALDQQSAIRVRPGMKAELSFENIRNTKLEGKVERIYPADNQFLVKVKVNDLPDGILPEMTADVAIEVARIENALLVPLRAIQRGKVLRRRNGRKELVAVKIGAVNSERAELLEGDLTTEDELIIRN